MNETIEIERTGDEIAIIGMAGRFPGAKNIEEFWNNLKNGIESIIFFSDEELIELEANSELMKNPAYVKTKGGELDNKEFFDVVFFEYTPKEAEILDPQSRIFHECAWEALENAGYVPYTYNGLIGLYAGAFPTSYWEGMVHFSGMSDELGEFSANQLASRDFLCTRIAYKFDLKGPTVNIQTACSTSLVAVHMACQAILDGECDMALAGGVSITPMEKKGYIYQEGMIFSPDGHCRAFDAGARGTAGGNGIGIVVMKSLKKALEEGDFIHAIIRGTAVNNDGINKAGYTAPSVNGQVAVIQAALQLAAVDPETITYVETHGTGTTLGDPIEIEALKQAFNTKKKGFCAIGSVKTNIGHLDAAAGVASLIKTVLALKNKLIPPSLHYQKANPKIDFENSPFYVNAVLKEWKDENGPRLAGISSFGIGGTNAHVILEEAPAETRDKEGTRGLAPLLNAETSKKYHLIPLSAQTQSALAKITQNLADFLKNNPGINLDDAAYTLQVGRKYFRHRCMLVCSTRDEAIDILSTPGSRKMKTFFNTEDNRSVVFMFPGLGSQYVNMGLELYQKEPVFAEEMDRCFAILEPIMRHDTKEILYPDVICRGGYPYPPIPVNSPLERGALEGRGVPNINQTEIAQLAIFIFEYALAQLLIRWGITPRAMIGYSFGEYVAACISGVFSLEGALKLIVYRGELIKQTPGGAMLSVPLPVKELLSWLPHELSVAIDNGLSCVVAGSNEDIINFEQRLKKQGILCMCLQAVRAIHSKMMEPILEKFEEILEQTPLSKPRIPFISNVTGKIITPEMATAPAYWAEHLKTTVQFSAGIRELLKKKNSIFVEIGPGNDLCSLVSRHFADPENHRVLNLIRPRQQKVSDINYLMNKIGQLWLYGKNIDWLAFYWQEKRYRIPLPAYPFEGQRYWIDGDPFKMGAEELSKGAPTGKKADIADWFYLPSWKRSSLDIRKMHKTGKTLEPSTWLVFIGKHPLGSKLVRHLEHIEQDVVTVRPALEFKRIQRGEYQVNPQNRDDYDTLLSEIKKFHKFPGKIIHMWGVSSSGPEETTDEIPGYEWINRAQFLGFYSLLYLAQAIAKQQLQEELQVVLVTDDMQDVTGEENLCPAKSTALGIMKVIPQEYPYIVCRSIDLSFNESTKLQEKRWIEQILQEFTAGSPETVIAYRGPHRWVQIFEPKPLNEPGETVPGLREKGIYLITGGLGDIGLVFAKYLAKSVKAKLILTGRSFFPPGNEREKWLEKYGEENIISRKIKKVMELEDLGGEVLVFSVDAADYLQVQKIINQAESRFGPINGIIHAAGIIKGPSVDFIDTLGKKECQQQFQTKIYGLLVLKKLFWEKELDFCWLISSIASILGGVGFAAYAAANIFMDTFVQKYTRLNGRGWISVNWDKNIPEEIISGFQRILALEKVNQIVFSSGGDIHTRIDKWVKAKSLREKEQPGKKETGNSPLSQSRPYLSTPYIAPGNQYQETIAGIWQNFLGYEQVGIQDNFFELGGDSLKAITVIAKIHKKSGVAVPLADFFNKPTIKDVAEYIKNAETNTFSPIKPVEEKEYYVLSSAQKRLYVLQQMDLESIGYNEFHMVSLEGKLDRDKLKGTFDKLIERHEVLRTSIIMVNDEAVQQIHDHVEFELEYYDMKEVKVEVEENEGTRGLAPLPGESHHSFMRPFDLSHPPFLRVGLIERKENQHLLMIDMHHIITDGFSFGIFVKELMTIYGQQVLPSLKLQYKDYSEWQNTQEQQEFIKSQVEYWLKEFEGEIPVLNLPTDYPRPTVRSFKGSSLDFEVGTPEVKRLKELGTMEDATLFMIITAIFNILLAKLSGQEYIIVGSPIAGRRHIELQNILGFFVNTLTLRNRPDGPKTFQIFLEEVKKNALKAFENQDYPFEELVEQVAIDRDLSRNPLFDVMFLLENMDIPKVEIPNLKLSPYEHKSQISKFDLELYAVEAGGKLLFAFQYCTKLFKQETIERFISYFKKIVTSIVSDPGIKISGIEIIPGEEKNRLLYDFNNTETGYPKDKTIHELFEEQVVKTPGSIAVGFEDQALTYRALNEKASQLANYLYTGINIRPEELAAVLMDRSMNMVTAILGILEAGGAYVPIDSSLPEARIKHMIDDAEIRVVISEKNHIKILNRLQWECKSFHTFLCMDSASVYEEEEKEKNELMDEGMWKYIGESAEDEITGGGWLSSYTGEPLSKEEMQEYSDNVFTKLNPLLRKDMRVLEIGCASGITMFRIAPYVSFYYGTDLSAVIIEKNKNQVKSKNHTNITLDCLPAHDIDGIEEENFDLIIMNSVIQYFHGHNYLRKVIAKAIDKLADKGFLFLGDIMDQQRKDELIRETREFKRTNSDKNYRTKTDWDAELFVSRGFIEDLALQTPGIQNIEFSDKNYTLENELTEFRYDALITIDKSRSKVNKPLAPQKCQHDLKILDTLSSNDVVFQKNQKVLLKKAAYVTYTSGTTGLPKGIMIEHRSVINFIKGMTDIIDFRESDSILSLTTISFDIFGLETLLPLTRGCKVVIGNHDEQLEPGAITRTLRKKEISILQLTPSRLQLLLSGDISRACFNGLKYLIVGGEAFPGILLEEIRRLFPGEIYNVYGPTETTIWSTIKNVTGERELNIGHPIANTQIYILDKNKKLLPVKVAGELYIGGDGLARGYLNKPKLTAEKFIELEVKVEVEEGEAPREQIPNKHISYMSYIYKTGDLVRWLPDGNIEFLGRIDHQVKIRGFRIELGEIERQLVKHEDIKEGVVICKSDKNGDKYLCAYIISGCELPTAELREYLVKYLPDYMIPSHFIRIEKIPLSTNGKIDRKALPGPEIRFNESFAAPENMMEEKLVEIWWEVLGIGKNQISTNSNFFYLGGHSLKATMLISRIHRELNAKVPLSEMFKNPTIESMAKFITKTDINRFAAIPPTEKKEYYVLSSAQKRMYIVHQMEIGSKSYNLPNILRLIGKLDRSRLQEACQKLAQHHESLITSFTMLEEEPVQQVHENIRFEMDYYEVAEDKVPEIINRFIRPFDLSRAPLLRVELVKTGESKYVLMIDMFHIISDAMSSEILLEDLITLYKGDELPRLRLQYKDYSEWHNRLFASEAVKKQEKYWLNRFKGDIPVLNLPTDYPRPAIRSTEGSILFFDLNSELTEKTRTLIAETGTTLYMVLLAVFNILLAKYTSQDEIIVGTPSSGRNHDDLQNIIGIFANMLAMKNHPTEDKSFSNFLKEIKENALKAYENQDYQFEELIVKLGLQMDPSRRPLFDVVLNMIKQGSEDYTNYPEIKDLTVTPYTDFEYNLSKYDLLLRVVEEPDRVNMSLEYPTALFRKTAIETMAKQYIEILNQVIEDKDIRIEDITISSNFLLIENTTGEEDVEFNF